LNEPPKLERITYDHNLDRTILLDSSQN
jgi:hypothetical protein